MLAHRWTILCAQIGLACFGQSAAADGTRPSPTSLVERSEEPMASVLTFESLPKTLSIDEFDAAEVQAILETLRDHAFDRKTRQGMVRCAAWLFRGSHGSKRLIGVQVHGLRGDGLVKLNGQMRSALVAGGIYLSRFDTVPIARLVQLRDRSLELSRWRLSIGAHVTSRKDAACTLVKSRCRHYTLDRIQVGWFDAQDRALYATRYEVADGKGLASQWVLEDFCPATSEGAIEDAKIGRLGKAGERLSGTHFGLGYDRSLKSALGKGAR